MRCTALLTSATVAATLLVMSFAWLSSLAEAGPVVRDHRTPKGSTAKWGGVRNPSPATKPGRGSPGNPPPLASKNTKVYPAQAVSGCSSGRGYCVTNRAPGGVAVTTRPRNKSGKGR
jgi:hypothetical protein